MKVETQPRDDQQVKLIVEIEPEQIVQYRHRAARKIGQQTKIPGFRPGKAPYDVIRRVAGEEYIDNQALELLVTDIYPKAVAEAGLDPSGPGMEDSISLDPPKFEFIVPLMPETTLGDYRAIRMEYALPKISDEDIDQYIHNMQTSYATAEPKEGKAEKGDLVYIKLSGTIVDPDEGTDAEFMKEHPVQMVVGDSNPESNDWPYKGFSDKLAGLAEKDEKKLSHAYPADSEFDRLKGKKVDYHVEVQSVKKLNLPELDDEFVKNFGDFESVAAFREKVAEEIQAGKTNDYDNEFKQNLIDEIVKISSIKFPPHYLEEETEHVLNQIQQDLSYQRMDLDTYIKSRQMTREAFIDAEVKPTAEKRLKQSLILDKIALLEKVSFDGPELNLRVSQTMEQIRNMPEFKKKKNEAKYQEITRNVTLNTATQLLQQNVFELLKRIAAGEAIDQPKDEAVEVAEKPKKATKKAASEKAETPAKKTAKKAAKAESTDEVEDGAAGSSAE